MEKTDPEERCRVDPVPTLSSRDPWYLVAFILAVYVFLKNAWVSEDAYIIFRSIDQLFAGNGPRWNPHERVQAFTSPLWFGVLSLGRLVFSDVYLNAIAISLIIWAATLMVLKKLFRDGWVLLLAVLLLVSSNGFYDFTSSGLENVLGYLIVALFLHCLWQGNVRQLLVLFGLAICVRHDLTTLLILPTVYAVYSNRRLYSFREWLFVITVGLLPVIIWTGFSIVYYGFPFPNTAYAKLGGGISWDKVIRHHGINYWLATLQRDPATIVVILAALVHMVVTKCPTIRALGLGITLNLAYMLYIGGDFMLGRFFSYAYLVSVLMLTSALTSTLTSTTHQEDVRGYSDSLRILGSLAFAVLLLHARFHTPLTASFSHHDKDPVRGVADERGFYFNKTSLISYLLRDKNRPFPDSEWTHEGIAFRESDKSVLVHGNIGFLGFYAGTDQIIIDVNALPDPLLARMRALPDVRVGHITRAVPKGYPESVVDNDVNLIRSPAVRDYYRRLALVTQSAELFALERWREILLLNTIDRRFHREVDIKGAGEPIIRSHFDIYLKKQEVMSYPDDRAHRSDVVQTYYSEASFNKELIYVKDACSQADRDALFSLHWAPTDKAHLPAYWQEYGFNVRDFRFEEYGVKSTGRCVIVVPLPAYTISEIKTGQFVYGKDKELVWRWRASVRVDE